MAIVKKQIFDPPLRGPAHKSSKPLRGHPSARLIALRSRPPASPAGGANEVDAEVVTLPSSEVKPVVVGVEYRFRPCGCDKDVEGVADGHRSSSSRVAYCSPESQRLTSRGGSNP